LTDDFIGLHPRTHVAFCSCLDDRTLARVHLNRDHALFLIIDPQSERPDGSFAAPTVIGVTLNAMAHCPAFGLERPAFQDFLDAPIAIIFLSVAFLQKPITLNA